MLRLTQCVASMYLMAGLITYGFVFGDNSTSKETTPGGDINNQTQSIFASTTPRVSYLETTPVPSLPAETPIFEVYDQDKNPCLKAQLEVEFDIHYEATTQAEKSVTVKLPSDARTSGSCGNISAQLILAWHGYKLWITFKQYADASDEDKEEEEIDLPFIGQSYWEASFIRFSFDTTNNTNTFSNVLHHGIHSVLTTGDSYFATPINQVHQCEVEQSINLTSHSNFVDWVEMRVSNVRLQPFDVNSKAEWGKVQRCDTDIHKDQEQRQRDLVPIVVAGCLAGVIILVVIAYIISKRTNKIPYKVIE